MSKHLSVSILNKPKYIVSPVNYRRSTKAYIASMYFIIIVILLIRKRTD